MENRLGKYVKKLRRQRDLTVPQVAAAVGLDPEYLQAVERGEREPSLERLYALVEFLDGNFAIALQLVVADAGIPEDAWPDGWAPIE